MTKYEDVVVVSTKISSVEVCLFAFYNPVDK